MYVWPHKCQQSAWSGDRQFLAKDPSCPRAVPRRDGFFPPERTVYTCIYIRAEAG